MKNIKNSFLKSTFLLFFSLFMVQLMAQTLTSTTGHLDLRSQNIYGNNASAFYFKSNNSNYVQLILRDKENKVYGRLYGSGDGSNFGLLDGDGNWSYLAAKDSYTAFRINNSEKMRILTTGNVGIGTTNPGTYKLAVNGKIRAKEVVVQSGWSDFVFEDDYKLPTLEEEKLFIEEKGHLIGFESEEAMGGMIQMGDVVNRQQQKIEESVLHLIELNEKIQELELRNDQLEKKNKELILIIDQLMEFQSRLEALESKE